MLDFDAIAPCTEALFMFVPLLVPSLLYEIMKITLQLVFVVVVVVVLFLLIPKPQDIHRMSMAFSSEEKKKKRTADVKGGGR